MLVFELVWALCWPHRVLPSNHSPLHLEGLKDGQFLKSVNYSLMYVFLVIFVDLWLHFFVTGVQTPVYYTRQIPLATGCHVGLTTRRHIGNLKVLRRAIFFLLRHPVCH